VSSNPCKVEKDLDNQVHGLLLVYGWLYLVKLYPMQKLLIIALFACPLLLSGQSTASQIQDEIDQQVWKPFQKAFESLDAAALNAIYADQVLRVTPSGIDTENEFRSKNLDRFASSKAEGVAIDLDFWFESRHTNASTSYEVGFFRISSSTPSGENSVNYGQFHIVLKKIEQRWKITQDWDTDTILGKKISAADFDTKVPREF